MTTLRLPKERVQYYTPVLQPHIDISVPCRMDNCTAYHALGDDLPTKFQWAESVRNIRSTSNGFTFLFDREGKTLKATCIYGTLTGKKIYRFDETWLRTRSLARARATMKPFTATWWIEKIQENHSSVMTEEDKKRLRKIRETGNGDGIGRGTKRRMFSQ